MSKSILVINGPNLNRLGKRQPQIYGYTTLAEVEETCRQRASARGWTATCKQSNSEAEIIGWIHDAIDAVDGIVINPAAFTHQSVAILDALNMFEGPIIELHISHPHKREEFRHKSFTSYAATALICGLGVGGYPIAVDALIDMLEDRAKKQAGS